MEQHLLVPGEKPKGELDGLLLCLWNHSAPTRCDHPDVRGKFAPKVVPPGTFSIYTEGSLPPVRHTSPASGLFVVLDEAKIDEAAREIRGKENIYSIADGMVLRNKCVFLDREMQRILEILSAEARNGSSNGHLFVDEYIQLFSERFLQWSDTRDRTERARYALDNRTIKRLHERFLATPARKLSLAALAADTGYSERHLFRSFRATTGRTPYQYVLDLRLEMARRLMLNSRLSLIDIAMECGFADHAHFTKIFRQRFGIPPSIFRKYL